MKIPDQEHRAALRSHSVESNDSTESLTELLDRVSYKSSDDLSEEPNSKEKETRSDLDKTYSKPNRPSRKTDKIEEAIKTSCKTKNDNMRYDSLTLLFLPFFSLKSFINRHIFVTIYLVRCFYKCGTKNNHYY